MERLILVRPTPGHRGQVEEYRAEHTLAGEAHLHGSAMLGQMEYGAWLEQVRNNNDPKTTRGGWVSADTFFAVRKADGRLIGMVDIRHTLNEFLAAYGGHIGYGVRPSERRKGYATEILRLALKHAKEPLGLPRVMISCNQDNEGSRRTILACGGRLERAFVHTDGHRVEVYWIELQPQVNDE